MGSRRHRPVLFKLFIKMIQGNLFKLFSYPSKHHDRLLYSLHYPLLSCLKRNLPLRFKSSDVSQNIVTNVPTDKPNFRIKFKNYYRDYFLKHKDIYHSFVDVRNIHVEDDTDFESLKLLNYSIRNADKDDEDVRNKLEKSVELEINSYSLDDIIKYIGMLNHYRFRRGSALKEKENMVKYLDAELLQRHLSKEDVLRVLHACSELPQYNYLNFTYKNVLKLCRKIVRLSPHEAVQLLYCMTNVGKESMRPFQYNFKSYLVNIIPKLNSDELGIVAAGLVKIKYPMNDTKIISALMEKTSNEIENMHPIPLLCVLKYLVKYVKFGNADINHFQESLIPYTSKIEGVALIYLAELGYEIRFINLSLWDVLANNFKRNIKNYSLHEIQRFINLTTVYNIQDTELLNLAIEEFEANEDYLKLELTKLLSHLIHHQLYPENLLRKILSKDCTSLVVQKHTPLDVRKSMFFINNSVEIEKPTLKLELMNDNNRKTIFRDIKHARKKDDAQLYITILNLRNILQNIYGESSVYFSRCIPSNYPGSVMRFDKNFEAQTIPQEFQTIDEFKIKKPLNDNHFWIFFGVFDKGNILSGTETFIFQFQTQIRQLKTLGFTPVLASKILLKTHIEENSEAEYIRSLLNKSLQELKKEKAV